MADTSHRQHNTRRTSVQFCAVLLMCLALTGMQPTYADAANRQDAIAEALSKAGSDSKVIGVRETTNENGTVVFAVKVLSNGRIRVFQIPKSDS